MVEPVISVIIPLYNAEEFICETLDSINNQSFKNWECLIIDDGSTDKSYEVVRTYCSVNPRFKLFKRPNNYKSGGSGARNYGFDISKGKYIQWFDSDDLMHTDMLKEKVKLFLEPNHAVICQTIQFKDNIKNTFGKPTKISSNQSFVDFFAGKIVFYTPGPLWRKSFLQRINLKFNEDLLNIQEWEFYCKILLQKNINIAYVERPLIYYRKHANSIWGRNRSVNKILSEFYGARSVYNMAGDQSVDVAQFYFQRLCRLLIELKNTDAKNEEIVDLKNEIYKSYSKMPFSIKNFVKLTKHYYFNL